MNNFPPGATSGTKFSKPRHIFPAMVENTPGIDHIKLSRRGQVLGVQRVSLLYGPVRSIGEVATLQLLCACNAPRIVIERVNPNGSSPHCGKRKKSTSASNVGK